MTLEQLKSSLKGQEIIAFKLPDGSFVPGHFHVTEVGKISKEFIDCGGTVRQQQMASLQLWEANDYDHRLHPDKLVGIIELSQRVLGLANEEIEVEYQGKTIERYGLDFDGRQFLLTSLHTDCLARENCGVPEKIHLAELSSVSSEASCAPGSGCC